MANIRFSNIYYIIDDSLENKNWKEKSADDNSARNVIQHAKC